ncbi:hypothetical protein RCL1_005070 [Eukaryota sp. TZLM3-RCL]
MERNQSINSISSLMSTEEVSPVLEEKPVVESPQTPADVPNEVVINTTTETPAVVYEKKEPWLKHLHLPFVALALGMGGVGLSFKKAVSVFTDFPEWPYVVLLLLTGSVYIVFSLLYLLKLIVYPEAVRKEFRHPIRANFLPIFPILFLILGLATTGTEYLKYGKVLIYIGSIVQIPLSLYLMSRWIMQSVKIQMCNPSCLIPPVGLLLFGLAWIRIDNRELSMFGFSVGLFWYFMIFSLFIHRVLFQGMLPQKFVPMLFILLAPPAITSLLIQELWPGSPMVFVFWNLAMFFLLLLIFMGQLFVKAVSHFELTWLAFVFPLGSFATSCLEVYHLNKILYYLVFAIAGMSLATLVLFVVLGFTFVNLLRGKVFVPEPEN